MLDYFITRRCQVNFAGKLNINKVTNWRSPQIDYADDSNLNQTSVIWVTFPFTQYEAEMEQFRYEAMYYYESGVMLASGCCTTSQFSPICYFEYFKKYVCC